MDRPTNRVTYTWVALNWKEEQEEEEGEEEEEEEEKEKEEKEEEEEELWTLNFYIVLSSDCTLYNIVDTWTWKLFHNK